MKNGGENKVRENNRNSIASMGKLPQFTTMNVIDGQAGLIIYTSLIFYSLTIDNILNIIVMLILAGVSLNATIGDNGIITQAQEATYSQSIAVLQDYINEEYVNNYEEYDNDDSLYSCYLKKGKIKYHN